MEPNNNERHILSTYAEVRFLSGIFLLLFILLVTSIVFETRVKRDDISAPSAITTAPFPAVRLGAQAAYVYDVRTKTVLYSKNPNDRLPLASLTKLMAATVARESRPEGGTVVVTDSALLADGDSGLLANESWSLSDLLGFSLVSSSNDGMRAIALALGALTGSQAGDTENINSFILKMNSKAGELGMENTYFLNETGLDETADQGGAYGTAQDLTKLFEYILEYHPDLLEATREQAVAFYSRDNVLHIARNTNGYTDGVPGILGSKTGYTDIAGGNLIIAFDPELGRPIIVAVLGSTAEGRFNDVATLVGATMEHITGVAR